MSSISPRVTFMWSFCPRHFLWDLLTLFTTTSLTSVNCPSLGSSWPRICGLPGGSWVRAPQSAISSAAPPTFDFSFSSQCCQLSVSLLCLHLHWPFSSLNDPFLQNAATRRHGNSTTAHVAVCAWADEQCAVSSHRRRERSGMASCWPWSTVLVCFYWVLHGMKN